MLKIILPFLLVISCIFQLRAGEGKPRTIVTTDGEIDDVDSFIRMLLYANEFKLEGLVYSSSMWHYKGDDRGTTMISKMEMTREMYGKITDLRWPGVNWMEDLLDAYETVYPKLSQHATGYPLADYLRSLIRVGNIDFEGDMAADTEGSNLIKAKLLDDGLTPIYLQAWGGTNTIARALKSIEDEYKNGPNWRTVREKVNRKAIIYTIMDQDATLRDYVTPNWPEVTVYYNANQFWALAYNWKKVVPEHLHPYFEGAFMGKEIINGHGPLTKMYYSYGDGQRQPGDPEHIHGDPTKLENAQWGSFGKYDFISEGDSPAFLHLVDVGLGNLEHPEWGGWGGRLAPSPTINHRFEDGPAVAEFSPDTRKMENTYPQIRWLAAIQHDFAARADWCVLDYDDANHPPQVDLKGQRTRAVKPGQRIRLRARAKDPDGDDLRTLWWSYVGPGTYGERDEEDLLVQKNRFTVPTDLKSGESIHLIFQATDTGTPALTRYGRLVLVGK